jgi:hypothetical protein
VAHDCGNILAQVFKLQRTGENAEDRRIRHHKRIAGGNERGRVLVEQPRRRWPD